MRPKTKKGYAAKYDLLKTIDTTYYRVERNNYFTRLIDGETEWVSGNVMQEAYGHLKKLARG